MLHCASELLVFPLIEDWYGLPSWVRGHVKQNKEDYFHAQSWHPMVGIQRPTCRAGVRFSNTVSYFLYVSSFSQGFLLLLHFCRQWSGVPLGEDCEGSWQMSGRNIQWCQPAWCLLYNWAYCMAGVPIILSYMNRPEKQFCLSTHHLSFLKIEFARKSWCLLSGYYILCSQCSVCWGIRLVVAADKFLWWFPYSFVRTKPRPPKFLCWSLKQPSGVTSGQ